MIIIFFPYPDGVIVINCTVPVLLFYGHVVRSHLSQQCY